MKPQKERDRKNVDLLVQGTAAAANESSQQSQTCWAGNQTRWRYQVEAPEENAGQKKIQSASFSCPPFLYVQCAWLER